MTRTDHGSERREAQRAGLSDDDLDRIGLEFDKRLAVVFESIGYDVSTQNARSEIRDDHAWIRRFRSGSAKAQMAAAGAVVTGFIGGFLWLLWYGFKAALMAAKVG